MPFWVYSNPPEMPPPALRRPDPVKKCIYCDSTNNLTVEHVVPKGMRGAVTLSEASCEACRKKITHELETACMRKSLLHARIRLALHQNPHERPDTHPVTFTYSDRRKTTKHIPVAECPIATIMPIYEYPGILRNVTPEDSGFGLLATQQHDDANRLFAKLLKQPGVKSVSVESQGINSWVFARWLAKIGYSFSVACLGYNQIKHSPLRSIITIPTLHFGHLIGGLNGLVLPSREYWLGSPTEELFNIDLRDYVTPRGLIVWAVTIRLMPKLRTPTYFVVVGERL